MISNGEKFFQSEPGNLSGRESEKNEKRGEEPPISRRGFLKFLGYGAVSAAIGGPQNALAALEKNHNYSELNNKQRSFLKQFEARMKELEISNYSGNMDKLSRMFLNNRSMEEVENVARVMEQGAGNKMINKIIKRYNKNQYLPSQGYDLHYYVEPVTQGEEKIYNEVVEYTKDGEWELKDFIQLRNYDPRNNKDPFFERKLSQEEKEELKKELEEQAQEIVEKEKRIFEKLKKSAMLEYLKKTTDKEEKEKIENINNIFKTLYWFRAKKGLFGNVEWKELYRYNNKDNSFFGLKADSDYYGSNFEVAFYTNGKIKISLTQGSIKKDIYFKKDYQGISLEVTTKDLDNRSYRYSDFYKIKEEDFDGQYLRSLLN